MVFCSFQGELKILITEHDVKVQHFLSSFKSYIFSYIHQFINFVRKLIHDVLEARVTQAFCFL